MHWTIVRLEILLGEEIMLYDSILVYIQTYI